MNKAEKALLDIKMNRAFEKGQQDSYRGLPMSKQDKMSRDEIRSYITGYHSMVDRKSYG